MQPSLLRRLASALSRIPALLAASKALQPYRSGSEFSAAKLRTVPVPPAVPSAAFGWPLQDIRDARADQIDGRFRRPVQLAVAMRTHGDLFTAYRVRTSPLASLGVEIVPAEKQRGAAVAREAEVLFGEPGPSKGVGLSRETVKTIIGNLANHGVAIGYNAWADRADGSRHDVVHRAWPLEFVEYDSLDDQLYTSLDPAMTAEERKALESESTSPRARLRPSVAYSSYYKIPIVHGDGRWTVYRLSELHPWRTDAALLAAALVWASAAFADRDWNRGSTSHGNPKLWGQLKEGVPLQRPVLDSEGDPTGEVELSEEAQGLLDLLEDLQGLEQPYGVTEAATKITLLANSSDMWQVWKELALRAQQLAALVYTGTTAYLGSQGNAPGVDIAQLMNVSTTVVQADKAAFEQGFHEGVMVPWAARNFGDSSLAPQRLYLLPDVDAQQNRVNDATNEAAFTAAIKARREAGLMVTQEWVNQLAARLGVETLELAASQATGFQPAPTDAFKLITANEGRGAIGFPPRPDGEVPAPLFGQPEAEPEPASGVRPAESLAGSR